MDAANRWETEAIRESRDRRRARPVVSQDRAIPLQEGEWVTLREASDAIGIPINTLRKWCRHETVDSYLEADGDLTLRVVELESVRNRARALGRSLQDAEKSDALSEQDADDGLRKTDSGESTMIVPVDAWNKLLTQLGNLHEAGQQLAEARERAAKAETEAKFLRERLAEMRESHEPRAASHEPEQAPSSPSGGGAAAGGGGGTERSSGGGGTERSSDAGETSAAETTSFWRYVARGWKGRRR